MVRQRLKLANEEDTVELTVDVTRKRGEFEPKTNRQIVRGNQNGCERAKEIGRKKHRRCRVGDSPLATQIECSANGEFCMMVRGDYTDKRTRPAELVDSADQCGPYPRWQHWDTQLCFGKLSGPGGEDSKPIGERNSRTVRPHRYV